MTTTTRLARPAAVVLLAVAALGLSSCTPGQRAADHAVTQVGVAYRYGGATPAGFDCSGLVQWAYGKAGVSIPRTSSEQYRATRRISKADLAPGDLVFWGSGGSVSHVGMYIGGGEVVQARKAGTPVQIVSVDWWATNRIGYGRVAT